MMEKRVDEHLSEQQQKILRLGRRWRGCQVRRGERGRRAERVGGRESGCKRDSRASGSRKMRM